MNPANESRAGGAGATVRVQSPYLGELELDPAGVFELPAGLLGLPALRRFAVVDLPEGGPFKWLQCLDDPDYGFVIAEPTLFFPDYHVPLRREEAAALGLAGVEEAVVFVLVTVGAVPEEIVANLRGPVVVSLTARRGMQLALTDPRYPLRAPLPGAQGTESSGAPAGAPATAAAPAGDMVAA